MKRRSKDAPTWINHPRHGWLVDACPLFETRYGELWMATGRYGQSSDAEFGIVNIGGCELAGEPATTFNAFNAPFLEGWDRAGTPDCYFQPVTSAARDLISALKAEQEPK